MQRKNIVQLVPFRLWAPVLALSAITAPVHASAPSASMLSLAQASGAVNVAKLPICTDKLSSGCRKKSANGTWIIVGVIALAGALAAAGGSGSVSP